MRQVESVGKIVGMFDAVVLCDCRRMNKDGVELIVG